MIQQETETNKTDTADDLVPLAAGDGVVILDAWDDIPATVIRFLDGRIVVRLENGYERIVRAERVTRGAAS